MTAQEFIIERIEMITDCFPNLKCTYEYNKYSNIHLVEVLPRGEFKDNKKYAEFEAEITYDFICKYSHDSNVSFFTAGDALNAIKNPTYTIVGKEFKPKNIKNFWFEEMAFINVSGDNYGENNYAMAA